MKKHLLVFPLCVLMALFLLLPSAYAGDAAGQMSIEKTSITYNKTSGDLSFDVKLSGAPIAGRVFAVLHEESESGQVKNIRRFDVTGETVTVSLTGVAETDFVCLFWVDANNMPVAECESGLHVGGDSFEAEIAAAMQNDGTNGANGAQSSGSKCLLVKTSTPLNWKSYEGMKKCIEGPNQLYVLLFETPTYAKNCQKELSDHAKYPSVEYAELDSMMAMEDDMRLMGGDTAELSGAGEESPQKPKERPYSWGVTASGIDQYVAKLQRENIKPKKITVAVVDSGVDKNHEFLKDRLLDGYNCLGTSDELIGSGMDDELEHGTHVTGIVADCTDGMNVDILPVRVLDKNGNSTPLTIATGIRHAANHGAKVINLSIGYYRHTPKRQVIDEAIQYALKKDITVVVAACNSDADAGGFCPAHIDDCITVAAVDENLNRWSLSNFGNVVDIAAPGVEVDSCLPNRGKGKEQRYEKMSGTSMAAPHVAAAAALLLCEHPEYTPSQVSDALKKAARPLDSRRPIGGFLNMLPFIEKTVTVTFNANGGTGNMPTLTIPAGTPTTLKANEFLRSGYRFVGWNTNADGSGTSHGDKAQFTASANITLYAQWEVIIVEEKTAAITFDANGGTGTMTPQVVTIGTPTALNANAFSRSGYQFANWNTNADGSGTSYANQALFTASANVTLYAQWNPIDNQPHALLYTDGTLDFRNSNVPAPGKTLDKGYKVPLADVAQYSPWHNERAKVKKVTFSEAIKPYSTAQWFYRFTNLTEVSGLSELDTSQTTDMSKMFAGCTSLITLDLSMLDTSSVTNMKGMFANCDHLTELNLTGWNTSNVTEMSDMFNGCFALKKVYASEGSFAAGEGLMTPFNLSTLINANTTLYAGWKEGISTGLVIGSGTVDVSDTNTLIPITIEKKGNTGAASLQFDVVFPDELVLAAKPEVGTLFEDAGLHRDKLTSPYTVSLGSDTATTDTTGEGVLVTLYFKLRPGAAADTYNITIQEQENLNAALDPVTFPVTDGHITASADGSGLVVGTGTAVVGDTGSVIPVTIEKKGHVGVAALQFDVVFPDELILTSKPEVGTLFADPGLNRDVLTSPYTVSLGDDTTTTNVTDEGVLLTLYFKVKAGTAASRYNITLQNQEIYDVNFDPVSLAVTPGYITVSSGASLSGASLFGDDGSLVVGSGTVNAGDTNTVIPITIEKKGTAGIISSQFDVVFPDELILIEKPTVGTLLEDVGLLQDVFTSPYTIALGSDTSSEDITDEGNLVTLKFKVKPGTAPGTYNIRIQNQETYDVNFGVVTLGVTNGAITVLPSGETVVVTFDGNGGTPATKQVTIGKGATVTPPVPNPTRDGYSFTGWFTSKAGKVSNSVGMFNGCTAIVGQQGTKYDPAHTDITYAHVDGGTSKPGYFSKK